MPLVSMTLSPRADQVRTARMVAATAARRSGVAEELLDDVRLAVAEACSRAVRRHAAAGSTDLVELTFTDDVNTFSVAVIDHAGPTPVSPGGLDGDDREPGALDGDDREPGGDDAGFDLDDPDALSLALIAGLIPSHQVAAGPTAGSTQVTMTWPLST